MTFELDTINLYKNISMQLQNRSYNRRKARTIANNLLRDWSELPLAWDKLTGVEMSGIVEEEPIQIDLYFGIQKVIITSVVVGEKTLTIIGAGMNYGDLVY